MVPVGKSKGERWFDGFTYGMVAGVGTLVVTLVTALSMKYGRGKPHYDRAVNWMERKLTGAMKPTTARKFSEEFVQTTALMQGGNLMLLPVGLLEHNKVSIVSGLNTMMGDPTPPEKVEAAPKQTWSSLIEGRFLAWTAVFVAFFGSSLIFPKSFQTFTSEFGERMHALVGKFKDVRSSAVMKETRAYKVGQIAALDIFATAAAATLLYVGGHFFARKHEEKKELREARRHADPSAPHQDITGEQADEPAISTAQAQVSGAKVHHGTVAQALAKQQGA